MIGGNFVRLDARGKPIRGIKGQLWVAGFDPDEKPFDYDIVAGRPQRSGLETTLEANWARDRGLGVGDTIAAASTTGRINLRVVGLFRFSSGFSFGGAGMLGMPLFEARRVMHRPYGWDQITLQATDRSD